MLGQAFCTCYLCSDPGLFLGRGDCSKMFPGPSYPCPSTAEFTQQTAPCRGVLKHHKPLSFLLGSHRWMPCYEISDLTCSASEKTLLPIGSLSSEELRAAGEAHQSCPLPHASWDAAGSSRERVMACPVITMGNGMGAWQGADCIQSFSLLSVWAPPLGKGHEQAAKMTSLYYQLDL